MTSLTAFLPVVVILVVTPGVNNLVVLRHTLATGPRAGVAATAGTSTGILVWSGFVAAGLGAVLRAEPQAWSLLQWLGAAVLVVLGGRSVVCACVGAGSEAPSVGNRWLSGSFLAALATSLLNPRAGVVAVALLPQFVAPGAAVAPTTLVLGVTWALVAAAWNLLGVAVVHRSGAALSRPRARRATELASGVFMAGIGVSVALAA